MRSPHSNIKSFPFNCFCVALCSVGGLVLLDGAASIPGHGAELAQHSGGEDPSY